MNQMYIIVHGEAHEGYSILGNKVYTNLDEACIRASEYADTRAWADFQRINKTEWRYQSDYIKILTLEVQ